jgi:hypothetical protein
MIFQSNIYSDTKQQQNNLYRNVGLNSRVVS